MKIIIMLALAIATLAPVAHANKPHLWGKWNIAPFASSIEEARRKAPEAIDGFNLPLPVKEHFRKAVLDSCKCRVIEAWLTPDLLLEQMWSGGQYPYVMSNIMVGELPVLKSPDGRSYRKGAVAETAKARSWTFAYEGKTYILYLPYVCFNWSWAFGPPPVSTPDRCVELLFNAPVGGFVRWGVASNHGPLPSSACNAQKQGNGPWMAWYGKCDECVGALEYIRGILGGKAEIYHKYFYSVAKMRQTLRFSTEIWEDLVYICLEYPDGTRTLGVYMRPQDWKGQYEVIIPDTFWVTDK
ncbi:MAG: hypothetical protein NTY93_00920 [Candidatus Kaiserbacteria bacterium]|nr:hypothetical protein [Candidatus Kaiserbacteria bacterium]